MKKLFLFLYLGVFIFIISGCGGEQEEKAQSEIPKDISGTWTIKQATLDVSAQNIQLIILNDGSWQVKQGGDITEFGSYSKKGEVYHFVSEKSGEVFTVNAAAVGQDIVEMKVKSNMGTNIEINILKTTSPEARGNESAVFKSLIKDSSSAERCKQTERAMKSISTALEAYAVDWGAYPSGSFESLKSILSPAYIKEFPLEDGWGNRWIYEWFYDKSVSDWPHIKIISPGSDGRLSYSSENDTSAGDDIVIIDGRFIKRCSKEQ